MTRATLVLIAGMLFGQVAAAQTQGRNDPWRDEVRVALDSAAKGVTGAVALRDGGRSGMLSEREEFDLSVRLEQGATYIVIAACDRDCGRLGLRVTDPRRYELDADQSATRQPVLRVTTRVGGVHRFNVVMAECRVNPCRYGLVVLRIPGRPAPRGTTGTGLISPHGRPQRTPPVLAGSALGLRPRRGDPARGGGA